MSNEGLDINSLLEQAQQMQQQMAAAQEAQASQTVTGSAGGGKVEIEANGVGEFSKVTIHPDAVDPDDIELLEELVLAALRDLAGKISEASADAFGGFDLPDMGDLGKMLGGGE